MKRHIILALLILLSVTLGLGCGSRYSEGDETANKAFKKMTIEEQSIYTGVEDVWGASYLISIRDAIRLREIKPNESTIPFIDVANIIISNNKVTLKMNDIWDTDKKNKKILGRWSRINESWYKQMLSAVGVTDFQPEKLIPLTKVLEEKLDNQKLANIFKQKQKIEKLLQTNSKEKGIRSQVQRLIFMFFCSFNH
jgi:hypothetical protein